MIINGRPAPSENRVFRQSRWAVPCKTSVAMKIKIAISNLFLILITSCVSTQTPIFNYVVYSSFADKEARSEDIFVKDLSTGSIQQLTHSGNNQYPSWSPDGSKIIFSSFTKENLYDINIIDKDGSNITPLINTSANERQADFSPNGKEIVFISNKDGNDEIYKMDLESKNITRLTNSALDEAFPKWSPDGNSIVFVKSIDGGRTQIYTIDASGSNIKELTKFTPEGFDRDPIFCPDKTCIIFTRLSKPDKLLLLDLTSGELTHLISDKRFDSKNQGFPARSPVSGYITFFILDSGESYSMNMKSKEIYPLGVNSVSLMVYP
jgi:Tol biopolymer transport system component